MLLPILFILMLPSLIFGGLRRAPSPDEFPDFDFTIMDDNAAIIANIQAIDESVREILTEAHGGILEQINAIVAELPDEDEYKIIDEFEANNALDTHLLISQFSASMDENYENINNDAFASLIQQHKDNLFSFIVTVEEYEITEMERVYIYDEDYYCECEYDCENPPTYEYTEVVDVILTHIFKVVFAGEEYFTNEVFNLTEEQAQLARYFAENLSLFLSTIG